MQLPEKYMMSKYKAAYAASQFLSPGVVWVTGIMIFSMKEINTFYIAIFQGLIVSSISLLVPILTIKKLKSRINLTYSRNITIYQKQPILLISLISGLFIAWLSSKIFLKEQPLLYLYFLIVGTLSLIIYVLRRFFNCSGHTTAVSTLTFLLSVFFSIPFWYFLPIIFLVAYSRITLKIHSIKDVIAGFILGISVSFIYSSLVIK